MKKLIVLLIVFALAASLFACWGGADTQSAPESAAPGTESGAPSAPEESAGPAAGSSAEESAEQSIEESAEESMEESSEVIERTWPCVRGTFVQPGAFTGYTVKDWEQHFNNLKEVGIDIFIIQWVAETPYGKFSNVYYPSQYAAGHKANGYKEYADFLPRVLEAAQSTGLKVFVGLNLSDEWWSIACTNVEWNKNVSTCGAEMAKEIYSLYKEQYPDALYGWYFAYEMFNGMRGYETRAGEFLNMYLEPLTELDPSMPVMLSPFVSKAGGTAAKAEQEWKKVFETANFREGDIFCCQDAVGAGHIDISQLDSYFSALKNAVDTEPGLHFWANSEDFTKEYDSAYVARFIKQMEIARPYVEDYVTFAYSHYYAKDYNGKGGFHRAYKHYYDTGDTLPELALPVLSYEFTASGNPSVAAVIANNAAGIRYIVFSAPGREDYRVDYPVARLNKESFTTKHTFMPAGNETKLKVTVTVTDYYGSTASAEIEIEFKQ